MRPRTFPGSPPPAVPRCTSPTRSRVWIWTGTGSTAAGCRPRTSGRPGSTHRSRPTHSDPSSTTPTTPCSTPPRAPIPPAATTAQSEEHTSELQSRGHLVCRLLLEKKKKITQHYQSQEVKLIKSDKLVDSLP